VFPQFPIHLSSDARGFLERPYNYYAPFFLGESEFMETFQSVACTPRDEAIVKTYRWFEARPKEKPL
jgi:hypothetical protein